EGEAKPKCTSPNDENGSKVTLRVMSCVYGFQLTPLQILTFYNGIANKGKLLRPLFIEKIEKSNGEIKEFSPQVLVEKMASDENIEAIVEMLTIVVSEGTAKNIFSEHYAI